MKKVIMINKEGRDESSLEIPKQGSSRFFNEYEQAKIPQDVLTFVQKYIENFIDWDLISYIQKNPGIKQTSSQIASNLGRKEDEIKARLKILTQKGIFKAEKDIYTPVIKPEIKEKLDIFSEAINDRTNRIILISMIVQKDISQKATYKLSHKIS